MAFQALKDLTVRSNEALVDRRFRALVSASAQIVWICSADGQVCEDSITWREFTGQSYAEFIGHGWLDALHPDDREITSLKWRQAVRAQTRYETTYRLRNKNGEWRWTLARGVPVFDDDGRIECWVGINNDVTEQVNARETLAESELHFRTLAENIPDLVWIADDRAQVIYWNPSWYQYTGQSVSQSLGISAAACVREDFRNFALERWKASVEGGRTFEMELPLKGRNGSYQWFLARARPIKDSNQKILRWCGVMTNIDALKRLSEEMSTEKANRERFVSALVHDLKNVIGAGATAHKEATEAEDLPESRRKLESIVDKSLDRATQMVTDLLDANLISAGRAFLLGEKTDISIAECFGSVVEQSFRQHRSRIRIDADPSISIRGSYRDVVRMVENLLGNAIKYGDSERPVTMGVVQSGRNVVWSVHNWGRAIPAEEQNELFEFLVRSRATTAGIVSGWGIGLTLVRGLARAHGGEVHLHSSLESGTVFKITMPIENEAEGFSIDEGALAQ